MATTGTPATVIAYPYSGDYRIDVLISGSDVRWQPSLASGTAREVTYSFAQVPGYLTTMSPTDLPGFAAFTAAQKTATRSILDTISQWVKIDFVEVTESAEATTPVGQIRFANNTQTDSAGYAYYPPETDDLSLGDVFLSVSDIGSAYLRGSYEYATLLHEIGHALGLKHPGNYNAGEAASTAPGNYLATAEDTPQISVMNYSDHPQGISRVDLAPFDLLALDYLYGLRTVASSDSTYTYTDSVGQQLQTLVDSGGADTIDLSALSLGATLSLVPGRSGSLGRVNEQAAVDNLQIALGTVIENVRGTAYADHLTGNTANNAIVGGGGNDTVDGGEGTDTLVAAFLPSQYAWTDGVLAGAEGRDTLIGLEAVRFGASLGKVFTSDVLLSDLQDPDGTGPLASRVTTTMLQISDLYVAYFNRAPDVQGLMYWFAEISSGRWQIDQVASSFTDQSEYRAAYPAGQSNADFITAIYRNLFDRAPDDSGFKYWSDELAGGMARDTFILTVLRGAYAPTGGASDQALLNHKHAASLYYSEQLALHPGEAFDSGIDQVLNQVTADAASLPKAYKVIDLLMGSPVTLAGLSQDTDAWGALWA